jgi:minor extracellular serine protease Vpr
MKSIFSFIFVSILIISHNFAQTKMSAETIHLLEEIAQTPKENSLTQDWITTHFPKLPIYKVNGEFCLSTVLSVAPNFKKEDAAPFGYVGSQLGQVVTLKMPIRLITSNLSIPNVNFLEIAERIQPQNNKLTKDVRADSVWLGINLPQSYTGKNVLIGITDWGFDYNHPMFMDTTLTTSRVRAAWDHFKLEGTPPTGMSYGVEYNTPSALATAASDTAGTYYDYATHGSHVAGIAGGSGAGLPYRGVAFEAEYLFNSVQLDVGAAIDGLVWMKSIADADGKRLVINASWGLYYMGTMDGTSLLSQAITNLADNGVLFVTSAGNNGNVNLHIKKDFNNDSIRSRINFYGYSQHPKMWGQCVSMWGQPNNPFGTRVEIYSNTNVLMGKTDFFQTQLDAGYHDTIMVIGLDTIFYNLTIDAAHPLNNRPHIRLRIKNTNTNLRVVMNSFAASGTVHYWNVVELSNGVGNWGLPFSAMGTYGVAGNSDYSIGEPACSEHALTIAAHGSETFTSGGVPNEGSRASFSSKGPTYDERMKPDVSAPGTNVVSSINSYTTNSYTSVANTTFNGRTYHFAAFSGTSMSSPATAGVAALVLEANPQLTAYQVKDIIKYTARQDNKTGIISAPGSPLWGMGKVTATAAVQLAINTVSVETMTQETSLTLYPNPTSNELNVYIESPLSESITYTIVDITGKIESSGTIHKTTTIDVAHLSNGIYMMIIGDNKKSTVLKFVKE